jgi:hypothetical protein
VAILLVCGENKIPAPVPVHGFGIGRTKTNAKSVAMDLAHAFANAVAADRTKKWECPKDCPKKIGPQVANEKTTELLTVKLDRNLYLSVVRRTFDLKVSCR